MGLIPTNTAAGEIIRKTPRRAGESVRAWSDRLARISGGAISPESFRKKIQRSENRKKKEAPHAQSKGGKVGFEESGNNAVWTYDGNANIKTLEDALKFSKVDLNVWEVERHVFNTWTTTSDESQKWNIQVKVWFKRRRDASIDWEQVRMDLADSITKCQKPRREKGSGVGFVCTADFHMGAYVDDLIRSDKFNISVLTDYLTRTADIINSKRYNEVHVCMLGDFIESFTGLNHANSWKGLGKGMFGMNAVILCAEIVSECLLSRINNLSAVYMVSGNHDRVTSEKEGDQKGEVGHLLHYILQMKMPHLGIKYHPMVLTEVIDDICYIMTHGHLPFSQRDHAKVMLDYGIQGLYNVLLKGHLHSRDVKKTYKSKPVTWEDKMVVQMDEANYRVLTAPSMFTGNFFSESLGYSSSAGFLEICNNGNGRVNVFDYCL